MKTPNKTFPIPIPSKEEASAKILGMCFKKLGTDLLYCWEVLPGSASSPILVSYSNGRVFWIIPGPQQVTESVARFYVEILQFFKQIEGELLEIRRISPADDLPTY